MARLPPTPTRPPKPATPRELRDAIRDQALKLGFDAVGFAPARLDPASRQQRLERLAEFVGQGFQGDMGWLGERSEERADPRTLWPGARTVVWLKKTGMGDSGLRKSPDATGPRGAGSTFAGAIHSGNLCPSFSRFVARYRSLNSWTGGRIGTWSTTSRSKPP